MTLVAAWIRQRKEQDQLVIASDSRLSFGARWDCCPKVFPLLREDSVIAFCGDTAFAYPILLQLMNAVRNYGKAESREMDISDLRPHFLKIVESMRGQRSL
jgi:ATP-dependent protease HslVU (ClpYQ) peptidase subunit